ncbi:MAG: U32 family peptidase [Clostridiales bacterium]|nr:U32 family peptidase [Candidatus Cacconaster stercorequi]
MAELLSPAGSWESLIAAVQSGADAVYMGFGAFNARRNAKNFTDEEFSAAVSYCHLRGVKVYLTLNTLLTDRELPAAADTLRKASAMGVDAVLVQDWGVWALARAVAPDVPLHASTQMSLHTLGGAKLAAALGLERVVLARELSREDIRTICDGYDAEIEVFVHGALCMCYSGQCAMSALIGQRSGNRGTCAQPCRLPYGVNAPAKGGHPLSLKDANLSAYLRELDEMGVACLKLEGRMKRPEYVAVITSIYRRLLDEKRRPTKEESRQLEAAFSRSGFTDWYYRGKKGVEMFGTRPENARWPEELFARVRQNYEKESRTLPVHFRCTVQTGVPATLEASSGDTEVSVTGAVPEAARKRALTAQELRTRLGKTGGTAFTADTVDVTLDEGLMLSAGAINALRRDALSALEQALTAMPERRTCDTPPLPPCEKNTTAAPRLTCSIVKAEQLTEELVACRPEMIYLPLELLEQVDLTPYLGCTRFCAVLPRIFRTEDEDTFRAALQRAPGLDAVAVSNLGHLPIVDGLGLEIRGDFGLNIFNSRSLLFLRELGLQSATVSFELRHQQIRDLRKYLPCEAIVYGRLPLMLMENCVIGNHVGCRCEKENYLSDRTGAQFPLLPAWGHRNEIENSRVLFLADKPEMQRVGLTWARLRFTTESPQECVAILRRYQGQGDWQPLDYTRGLFYRGVD